MDLSKLTQKAQQALQAAQEMALRRGNAEVDAEHVCGALLSQENGLVSRLLEKAGVSVPTLQARITADLEARPRVSGGATEAGKIYVTQRFNASW